MTNVSTQDCRANGTLLRLPRRPVSNGTLGTRGALRERAALAKLAIL